MPELPVIREYIFWACPTCWEQASCSYTGDPHLVCVHADIKPESLVTVKITLQFLPDGEVIPVKEVR